MKEFFECMRCYSTVINWLVEAVGVVWPYLLGYAAVYAVGATAFLFNLRAQRDSDGRLTVRTDSWAYMLARPYRYGQIKDDEDCCMTHSKWFKPTSICLIYARLLNMLLFVWPVLLVYFAVVCGVGSLLGVVVFGIGYIKPNLSSDGFVDAVEIGLANAETKWEFLLTRPVVWELATAGVVMAVFKLPVLLYILATLGMTALCISPVVAAAWLTTKGVRKVIEAKADPTTSVAMVSEYVVARKEKFCKMVAIK